MRAALAAGYSRWLDRRIPPARQITLGTRSLFILPTRMGLLYLLVLLAMSLLGLLAGQMYLKRTNYY